MNRRELQDLDNHITGHGGEDFFEGEQHGRWYGDEFCPHPGQPCIDGCYFCGRPVAHGEHDHTQTDKAGFKGATEDRYSCVCPNC